MRSIMNVCFDVPRLTGPSAVALGTFDGLHLGHRHVLNEMTTAAQRQGLAQWVFTFRNHPAALLRPENAPSLLTTWEEKLTLLRSWPLDGVVMRDFDQAFSEMEPTRFVQSVLCEALQAKHIAVGYNFRFGYRAQGDGQLLQALGQQFGFDVTLVPPFTYQDEPVSSTRIRQLISTGKLAEALPLLANRFILQGEVIHGQGIAAKVLGIPTANLALVHQTKLLPPKGVYACGVEYRGQHYQGVMNLGLRPTFDGQSLSAEVYLFDFSGDLYGQELVVSFHAFIRGEVRFSGPEALKTQIHQDIAQARQIFAAVGV